jgi:hypothetical protein
MRFFSFIHSELDARFPRLTHVLFELLLPLSAFVVYHAKDVTFSYILLAPNLKLNPGFGICTEMVARLGGVTIWDDT